MIDDSLDIDESKDDNDDTFITGSVIQTLL
jgi:hypothetical protein